MNLKDSTEIERKTYEFIKEAGEIQPKNMPDSRMVGAIASPKNKELVEIIKKYTSIFRGKKKKFVKAITWSSECWRRRSDLGELSQLRRGSLERNGQEVKAP